MREHTFYRKETIMSRIFILGKTVLTYSILLYVVGAVVSLLQEIGRSITSSRKN